MLVKGPFEIKWGDNTILDVEELDVEFEVESDDFETMQGSVYEVDGAYRGAVTVTLLASDIPALSALLPQNFVANGQQMSTGETVNNAAGAIDVAPGACNESSIYNNLDIISCGNPGEVFRLNNARTRLDSVEIDNRLRTVAVRFIGEPAANEATIQFFREGTIAVVS